MFIKTQYGSIVNLDFVGEIYIQRDTDSGKYKIKICPDDNSTFRNTIAEYEDKKEAWDNLNNFYTMLSYQIPSYNFEEDRNSRK